MGWQEYLGVIVAGTIIITLIGFMTKKTLVFVKTTKVGICIKVPLDVLNKGPKFGLLHIRDGKDESPDKGHQTLKKYEFKELDRRGTLGVSVRYNRKLGFQFKCYADYKGIEFGEIKDALENCGFISVGPGAGKPGRAWFIHPDYPIYETYDKNKNNFFYPE